MRQPALIKKLIGLENSQLTALTPLVHANLSSNESKAPDTQFLSRIGILLYLAQGSRPDLAFAVHYLARFALNPDKTHWDALNRLICYVRTTQHLSLKLFPSGDGRDFQCYVDANWGGEGSRSTHGFVTMLWGVPISWNSKRQTCVARSTCQAEYMALSYAAVEELWLKHLMEEIIPGVIPVIRSDNRAAVKISSDKASMKKTRHIDREFHFINEHLRTREIAIDWISGVDQLADILTKALGSVAHAKFTDQFFA